jgi:hypothetical protein
LDWQLLPKKASKTKVNSNPSCLKGIDTHAKHLFLHSTKTPDNFLVTAIVTQRRPQKHNIPFFESFSAADTVSGVDSFPRKD